MSGKKTKTSLLLGSIELMKLNQNANPGKHQLLEILVRQTMNNEIRMLCAENESEAVSFCCSQEVRGVSDGDKESLSRAAVQKVREESEKDPMPMGCSEKDARRHVNKIINRAYESMKAERNSVAGIPEKEQVCGFPILAIFSFLSALWTIFNAIRMFMYGMK